MPQPTAYERRVNSLLADEHYGPALARLGRADTGAVLLLVQTGDMRGARREIDRLDAARRAEETRKRDRRRRNAVVAHIQRELRSTNVRYSLASVSFGAGLMTRAQVTATLDMDAEEIRANAGDHTNIRLYLDDTLAHNPWWYH